MTTHLLYDPYSDEALAREKATRQQKLLIFRVGKLNLALLVDSVQKILRHSESYGTGVTAMGISHLGDSREITVIDLHKRLFKKSQSSQQKTQQFLILAKNSANETFGIIVSETPSLLDVPLSQIRVLPDSYRQSDTLDMATHVTLIAQNEENLMVFILDADQLVSPVTLDNRKY